MWPLLLQFTITEFQFSFLNTRVAQEFENGRGGGGKILDRCPDKMLAMYR